MPAAVPGSERLPDRDGAPCPIQRTARLRRARIHPLAGTATHMVTAAVVGGTEGVGPNIMQRPLLH